MKALVTGGAGFIGSHLVDRLVSDGHDVAVLDDLTAGVRERIPAGVTTFIGSVEDLDLVNATCAGRDVVFHLAAHRSVARSVDHPVATNRANADGTLTMLVAAHGQGVPRVVNASSSSVYGGAAVLPTPESTPLVPRSPYAVSKMAAEHHCRVYTELHGLETVSLRFFNVYGPRQDPASAYAAVIPQFIGSLAEGRRPEVHGDGLQTRDFTYVEDVVAALLRAGTAPAAACSGKAYNIAGGGAHSLLDILRILGTSLGVTPDPLFVGPRAGDVRHTLADTTAAERDLGHVARVPFSEGLAHTVAWFIGATTVATRGR